MGDDRGEKMRLENINIEIITKSIDRALDIVSHIDPKQFRICNSMTIRIIDEQPIHYNSKEGVQILTNVDDAEVAVEAKTARTVRKPNWVAEIIKSIEEKN